MTSKKSNEISSWDDLNCDMNLLRGIYSYGFEEPSTIQKKTILQKIIHMNLTIQVK